MATVEEIAKLKKELQDLYDQMGRRNPINVDNIKDATQQARVLTSEIQKARELFIQSSNDLGSLVAALNANVQEITRGNQGLIKTRAAIRGISDIATRIKLIQEDTSAASEKELSNLQKKLDFQKENLSISKDLLETRLNEKFIEMSNQDITEKQRKAAKEDYEKTASALRQVNAELSNTDSNISLISQTLDDIIDEEKLIKKTKTIQTY